MRKGRQFESRLGRGLTQILTEAQVDEAAFLTIDVQGAEEVVLRTADLGLVRGQPTPFKVVLVEAESTDMPKNLRVRAMLEGAGLLKLNHTLRRPFSASYNEL